MTKRRGLIVAMLLGPTMACLSDARVPHAYVTFDVQDRPVSEVLSGLAEQTGVRIHSPFGGGVEAPLVTVRADRVPFRGVLREVAAQCGCHVECRLLHQYALRKGPDPREASPTARAGPYTLRVRSVRVSDSMALDFMAAGEAPLRLDRGVTLNIEVEADDDLDLARIYALHPAVRAVDDRGRAIAPARMQLPEDHRPPGIGPGAVPWVSLPVGVALPVPPAASLRSVEGELLVYAHARYAEFVLPLDRLGATATDGDCTLGLMEARRTDAGYTVKAKLTTPAVAARRDQAGGTPRTGLGWARLEAADGQVLKTQWTSWRGGIREGQRVAYHYELGFRLPAFETPARLVLVLMVIGGEPESLRYSFANIPLPTWQE